MPVQSVQQPPQQHGVWAGWTDTESDEPPSKRQRHWEEEEEEEAEEDAPAPADEAPVDTSAGSAVYPNRGHWRAGLDGGLPSPMLMFMVVCAQCGRPLSENIVIFISPCGRPLPTNVVM